MTAAESSGPLAELVAAHDVVERWRTLPLRDRRTVTEQLLTATVLPVTKGARFSPEQVRIEWRTA
jgi:site-specific DNA recombinase